MPDQFGAGFQVPTIPPPVFRPPVRPRKLDKKPPPEISPGPGLFGAPFGFRFPFATDPTFPRPGQPDPGLGGGPGFPGQSGPGPGAGGPGPGGGGGGGGGDPFVGPPAPGTPGPGPLTTAERLLQGAGTAKQILGGSSGGGQDKDPNIDRLTEQFVNDLLRFGTPSQQQGLINLFEILQSQGQSDPAILNNILSEISRDTAANQQNVQGQFAQQGIQGSGVAQAISAALGQSGVDAQAGARLEDLEQSETRRRQDLQLLNELLFGTNVSLTGANLGVPIGPREPSDLETGLNVGGGVLDLIAGFKSLGG